MACVLKVDLLFSLPLLKHWYYRDIRQKCVILSLLFTRGSFPQTQWGFSSYIIGIYRQGKDQKEAYHCLSALTAVLHTWAAGTDVRAGVPFPCHAIHGVSVVNGAMGYQIWRTGRTARPLLTDTCQGINWSDVTFRDPLVYTLKIRCLVLIWWVPARLTEGGLKKANQWIYDKMDTGFLTRMAVNYT